MFIFVKTINYALKKNNISALMFNNSEIKDKNSLDIFNHKKKANHSIKVTL